MSVETGQEAPDFELPSTDGDKVRLSDLRGKENVVLVFYPFTFTGVCQGEMCSIRDNLQRFAAADALVFGIACDSKHAQKKWHDEQGLTFPLLSDFWPHGEVARSYGVFNETLGAAERATFVIGRDGNVTAVFRSPDLATPRAQEDYEKALAQLS